VRERTSREGGKQRSVKILTGHSAIGVYQLCTNGLHLHLGGPEHGLSSLEAFPESLCLQDQAHVRCRRKLTIAVGRNKEMPLSLLIE
jgi:hypothetical protein